MGWQTFLQEKSSEYVYACSDPCKQAIKISGVPKERLQNSIKKPLYKVTIEHNEGHLRGLKFKKKRGG